METKVIHIKNTRDLGLAVRLARESKGITREDMASELDTSPKYLWEIESGKHRIFLSVLLKFLRLTGAKMTVSYEVDA